MSNPFKKIDQRLSTIEELLKGLSHKEDEKHPSSEHERLTRTELCQKFKISLGTVHNLMKSGGLPYEKIGRKTLFKLTDVEEFFSSRKR